MITKIEINGFKSFSDFKMEFSPLTVIAGTIDFRKTSNYTFVSQV